MSYCLHFNKLPLRHFSKQFVKRTTRYRSYCDPIGKNPAICSSLQIAKFKSIKYDLQQLVKFIWQLNRSTGLKNCKCSADISCWSPGPISKARLIIILNGNFRLYVGAVKPSSEVVLLSKNILKMHCTGCFRMKMNPLCIHGAQNMHTIYQRLYFLPFSRDAYFTNELYTSLMCNQMKRRKKWS